MSHQHIIYENAIRQAGFTRTGRKRDELICIVMLNEIIEVLVAAEKDDDVRVLVLTGKGKAFCAGADPEVSAGFGQKEYTLELIWRNTASCTS